MQNYLASRPTPPTYVAQSPLVHDRQHFGHNQSVIICVTASSGLRLASICRNPFFHGYLLDWIKSRVVAKLFITDITPASRRVQL